MVSDIQIHHAKSQEQRRGQGTDHNTYIFGYDQYAGHGFRSNPEFAADTDNNREKSKIEGVCSQAHDQRNGQSSRNL